MIVEIKRTKITGGILQQLLMFTYRELLSGDYVPIGWCIYGKGNKMKKWVVCYNEKTKDIRKWLYPTNIEIGEPLGVPTLYYSYNVGGSTISGDKLPKGVSIHALMNASIELKKKAIELGQFFI